MTRRIRTTADHRRGHATLWLVPGGGQRDARHQGGRADRAARPLGLRQDHAAAHHRGLHRAERGPRRHRRRRWSTSCRRTGANVGIVFQNYALFPHMTIADNIAYGLAARGMSRDEQKARVAEECWRWCSSTHIADRYPKQLSGGQQQRVALARALAVKPSILLLDEPFAALDKNLRLDMQIEIKRIQRLAGTTTVLVTHDQEEALSMADRVAVLNQGRLEQFATPDRSLRPAELAVRQHVRRHRQHAAGQARRARTARRHGRARHRRRHQPTRAPTVAVAAGRPRHRVRAARASAPRRRRRAARRHRRDGPAARAPPSCTRCAPPTGARIKVAEPRAAGMAAARAGQRRAGADGRRATPSASFRSG